MSKVTNIIITASLNEDVEYLLKKFREFNVNGNAFNLVSIDTDTLPRGWYGGSKMMAALVFLGAFNYLNLQGLIVFLRDQVKWVNPECAQLICKEEKDFKFTLIDLFSE